MLIFFLRNVSFLLVSLLLVSCASQKSINPSNTADANRELNSVSPARTADNLTTEKPIAVSPSPAGEIEKEARPVKETTALEPTTTSPEKPTPENVSITLNVQFDTGRANVKSEYHNDIKRIADLMNKYPSMSVVIAGHTDNVGKETFNVKLYWLRANNIKLYLTEKFGIDSSRIRVIGYDYQKPIADNETAQGRQANRRGEIHIEANSSPSRFYSYIEDSDLLKGGFSIVNQESIDTKIKSYKEKHGSISYLAKTVTEPTLELYVMWGGIFSHCAIRSETAPVSFYQMELQTLSDLKKAGISDFYKIGAAIDLLGMTQDQFDIVKFTNKNERNKLNNAEPHYATMPICLDKKATRKTTQWYKDCLSRYAASYNPENAQKAGKPTKEFAYDPIIHNCCNFAEEALQACGLAHCFDLGKSTGLLHKAGPLEE